MGREILQMIKLLWQLFGLFLAFIWLSLVSYSGIKHGIICDRFGRMAARRDGSALIFWTLWSICTLTAVFLLLDFCWIVYLQLR